MEDQQSGKHQQNETTPIDFNDSPEFDGCGHRKIYCNRRKRATQADGRSCLLSFVGEKTLQREAYSGWWLC